MDDHKETDPLNFGLNIGLFSASPVTEELPMVVEVIKFQLKKPMTPRELYYVEKAEKDLVYGGRIGTLSLVNGLKGVISHGVWRGVDPKLYGGGYGEAFFSTHFSWGKIAWAINCWSNVEDRFRVRPLFKRIIASFQPTEVKIQSKRERQV